MCDEIPIVDISGLGLDVEDTSIIDEGRTKEISTSICKAFTDIGFCYLKNHGIPDQNVKEVMRISMEFFDQSVSTKQKYAKGEKEGEYHGWIARELEKFSPERPPDYKEAYNYKPNTKELTGFPEFEKTLDEFFKTCEKLGRRVLDCISDGFSMLDKTVLQEAHSLIGKPGNPTTLRTLYYPPITTELQKGQLRCSEHSDFGSITLLFQGIGEGLEVKTVKGEFVPAPVIPGAVLVNIGDLMQHWTADKFVATIHRVMIPDRDEIRHSSRQSVAFFIVPDDEAMIKCLDNSDKYEPVTSQEFITKRFAKTMPEGTYGY